MIHGFHHVAIEVTEFDKAVDFYTGAFGFTAARTWGDPGKRGVMLDTGNGNYMELFERTEVDSSKGKLIHLALRADNCDEMIEKARAAGAKITDEPKDLDIPATPPYPVRIAFFEGPGGERVEIFQER